MQFTPEFSNLTEEERIKRQGLLIDYDEIAKRGSMTPEEKLISKWYGIYASRQAGDFMARVVVPAGVVTATQARTVSAVASVYAHDKVCITTRQAFQFHRLGLADLPRMLRDLAKSGLSTFHGCGDVTRTITACPLAECCQFAQFDVRPAATDCATFLTGCRDLDNLPRKFKITFSGCAAGCAQPLINCVGMVAVRHLGQPGFSVSIGGGMGWKAFLAKPLFSFIPVNQTNDVTRAIAILFRDHGDRTNRMKSRLKFVVDRLGIDRCRDIVLENLRAESNETSDLLCTAIDPQTPVPSRRPLCDSELGSAGSTVVRIRIPKGEMPAAHLAQIATLSETYADERIYTTNRQNIELHGINVSQRAEVCREIAALGYAIEGSGGLPDVVSCVGLTYCPKAVSTTRDLFDKIQLIVTDPVLSPIANRCIINITGCPNSCSPYRIADIGFRGMRIRHEEGSSEGYELLIGGDLDRFGHKLGEFTLGDCPRVVRTILTTFATIRSTDETLSDCVSRLGVAPFSQAVYS